MAAPDANPRLWVLLGIVGTLAVIAAVVAAAVFLVPAVSAWVTAVFGPGLGLKTAAVIAVGVSLAVLVLLTVTAGDGLLGEIQFVIPGFFLFALFFWLMIAWVF
jgi:hypothetical protein